MFALYLQQVAGGGAGFLVVWVVIIGAMFFLMILPQQRQKKKWAQMVSDLKAGDKIITTGGVMGTIQNVKDDVLTLRVPPDNLRVDVRKGFIATVVREEEEKKTS